MFNGSAFYLFNRSMYVEIFLLLLSFSDQIITIKWTQFQNINNTRRVCFKHRVFTLHINLKYCTFIQEGRVFEINHTIWHVTLHIVLNYRTSISVFLSLPWNIVKLNNRSTMYLSNSCFGYLTVRLFTTNSHRLSEKRPLSCHIVVLLRFNFTTLEISR